MVSALLPLRARGAAVRLRGGGSVGPVDLEIAGAGVTVIVGPNGSGKTTLLKMLHGILRLSEGEIRWACPRREAERRQAFVFQTPVVLRRSVAENLRYPLRLRGASRREAAERAAQWAARFGLEAAMARPAQGLSGGERQKLAIARALATGPEALFLDEPCAALDGAATRVVESALREAARAGTRIVMSTHEIAQARRLASEAGFMLHGELLEMAPAEAFFAPGREGPLGAFLAGEIVG